eukprot:GHVS01074060.1.p1 GENE.GHVS01074060.1~~GHVS01074060.1.p1  ORF type:complete len:417 (-),score=76.37 GHVS01074060.1:1571-2821(-)
MDTAVDEPAGVDSTGVDSAGDGRDSMGVEPSAPSVVSSGPPGSENSTPVYSAHFKAVPVADVLMDAVAVVSKSAEPATPVPVVVNSTALVIAGGSTTSLALSAPADEKKKRKDDNDSSDSSSSSSHSGSSSSDQESSSSDSESNSDSDALPLRRKKQAPGSDSDEIPLGKKNPVKAKLIKIKPEPKGSPPEARMGAKKRGADTKAGGMLKRSKSSASNLAAVKGCGSSPRRKVKQEEEEEEDQSAGVSMGVIKNRTPKQQLVAQFLKRWWFALPPWPPTDYDFNKVLEQRKLKWISLGEWEDAEDVDEKGYTKVYQISSFPGVFRDPNGEALDLRPKDSCPSYSNFIVKSELELLQLISKAINQQLVELQKSPYDETANRKNLMQELSKVDRDLDKLERREGFLKDKKQLTNGVKG